MCTAFAFTVHAGFKTASELTSDKPGVVKALLAIVSFFGTLEQDCLVGS